MELKGSIQSIMSLEKLLITSLPYTVLHDGGHHLKLLGVDGRSKSYCRVYQLFPLGARRLWEERVNVRFHFDGRFGVGTMKISAEGMELLPKEVRHLMEAANEDVYLIPHSKMTLTQAKRFGALNLEEKTDVSVAAV